MRDMKKDVLRLIVTMMIGLSSLQATVNSENNLTEEQLHAFMGIITNFILMDEGISVPTLTTAPSPVTMQTNETIELHGNVGDKIYINGEEVGEIDADGKVTVILSLDLGENDFDIVLKNSADIMSAPLHISILREEAHLLINEISSAYYTNDDRWFEIYNPTNANIDISTYRLKSYYYDGTSFGIFEFSLPSKTIAPNSYLIIRSDYGAAYNVVMQDIESNEVIYLKDTVSNKFPVWYSDEGGFLELLKDGKTMDFVLIDDSQSPVTSSAWSGNNVPAFTSTESEFWKSIARDVKSSDTNSASDWKVQYFPTYAGVNDVTCNDDVDNDGIPDCSEVSGSTYAGMDLYAFGARVNQKDIFIEVDYMDSTNNGALNEDKGVVPQQEALQKVKDSFATKGYVVHFDVGDLFAQNGNDIDLNNMDLGGGNQIPYAQSIHLDEIINNKAQYMETRRKQIFYYMVFGTSQNSDGSAGASGIAEQPGNDVLISLGGNHLSTDTTSATNSLINFQAATVMHEFGHNLGLDHGGFEGVNYKPNYFSIMNYLYQLNGLSTIGSNEGDRYYSNKGCATDTLTNPYWEDPMNFRIDYSDGSGENLVESNIIVESKGLGRTGSGNVDYDCNGNILIVSNYDVNGDGTKSTLKDYNDWAAINIMFARTFQGNLGAALNQNRVKASINPLMDDRQTIALEPLISIPTRKP